jgi:hypothetical protein
MDTQINLQPIGTDYDIRKNFVGCCKKVKLVIFGQEKFFEGYGEAYCTKENKFNPSFGKALAWIRASQDIGRQIEISLIKYTFDHFVEVPKEKMESNLLSDLRKLNNIIKEIHEVVK